MKKNLICIILSLSLMLSLVPMAQAATFTDIEEHWAKNDIENVVVHLSSIPMAP